MKCLLHLYLLVITPILFKYSFCVCKSLLAPTVVCTMIIINCVLSVVGLPHLFSSGGWPSRIVWKAQGASARAIFVTREHKSTITSVCA